MGKLLQFPGAWLPAPGQFPAWTNDDDYPHQVYPTEVTKTADDRWEPMPLASWSNMQFLRWQLGVIAFGTGVPVEVHCSRPSGGRFTIRIGERMPITALTELRTADILMGVYEAAKYLEAE